MVKATTKGEKPEPTPTPAKIKPFAAPRSCVGIHRDTNWLEAGYMMASPDPRRKQMATRASNGVLMETGTAAGSAVKPPHHRTAPVNTRRGPRRSASHPAGV